MLMKKERKQEGKAEEGSVQLDQIKIQETS